MVSSRMSIAVVVTTRVASEQVTGQCFGCQTEFPSEASQCNFACYDFCVKAGNNADCYGRKCYQLECTGDADEVEEVHEKNRVTDEPNGQCFGCQTEFPSEASQCNFACYDFCVKAGNNADCYGRKCYQLECTGDDEVEEVYAENRAIDEPNGQCFGCQTEFPSEASQCNFACYDFCVKAGNNADCYGRKCYQLECTGDASVEEVHEEQRVTDESNGQCFGCQTEFPSEFSQCNFACYDFCVANGNNADCYGRKCYQLQCVGTAAAIV